jgi:hypothetical protein
MESLLIIIENDMIGCLLDEEAAAAGEGESGEEGEDDDDEDDDDDDSDDSR